MAGDQAYDRQKPDDVCGHFLTGLGRGVAGALLFALPMFMTMEMWALGFSVDRFRLLLLLVLNIPLLVLLAHRLGFEETFSWREDLRDAMIAYAIGIFTSAIALLVIGVIEGGVSPARMAASIALQAVPASIGAMLGRSQLNGEDDDQDEDEHETGYAGEVFMMMVGALFLSLNVAPTEEVILIAYKMTPWHGVAVILISIAVMHGFVYALSFKGGHELEPQTPWWHGFVRFTLPGYVVAVLVSLYCLWTFDQLADTAAPQILMKVIVLSFPGAIGAAAARLIL